jgi:nascent polypeptide-associated complex subunit alpha
MIPGMNPKMLKQAMKKMGMKQEDIDALEVVIRCSDKEIVIRNPSVAKVDMMGQQNFQISGDIEERGLSKFNEEDIETVKGQTNCSDEEAKEALERNEGDSAKSILELK